MKKSLLLILPLTLFITINAFSQKDYKYCELVGYSKFLSTKVIVAIDSGRGVNFDVITDTIDTRTPIVTKNEKFYVTTKEKMYEGKTVQSDTKGTFIWKTVESGGLVEKKVKTKTFASMIEGMNFMNKNGWEFVQAYVVTSGNQDVYRWILKK